MAGLLLSAAGASIGGAIGGSFLGISSVVIGQSIGAVVGSMIDQYLFAPTIKNNQEGPRLNEANVLTSSEGLDIMRGYGRFKVAGNVIWAARFYEEVVTDTQTQGGKGGGGGVTTTTTTYNYYGNFAVGLCEGEIFDVHRIWADGKLMDLSAVTYRVYKGTETQTADSLIETKEGAGNAPAYRGLAYVVFEDLQLNDYGNRIPQLTFEVTRPVARTDSNATGDLVTGVNVIPGATEFGYDPEVVEQTIIEGSNVVERRLENAHLGDGITDWEHAMDQLEAGLPNCNTVSLVVAWFGDDLRIGNCTIKPKVENDTKTTEPYSWAVAGLTRSTADVLSQINGGPAFGGTPSDISVYRAIIDLKARGFEVLLYPFIMMDVASTNTLPNPYSDNAATNGQSAYPWRGRITCSPAAGYVGTVDKTATAATQIASFLGTADASEFSGSGGTVTYSGTAEWSYNRFILHLAELCRQAGGVDYFCIGTEMVNATTIRDNTNAFPFVDGLISLAAEVATLLPSTELSYAADWSEYHSYRPSDGTGDVYFHLDPLWADSNIDFIGIDNYLPISDWRDDENQADYGTGNDEYGRPRGGSIYDITYLKGQVEGGEYYDWFYASTADRVSQTRTAITDGAYSEPWVYRNKDLQNWWNNLHFNRPGGVKAGAPTSYNPSTKPIFFTEFGCPAINKGTNQPNVFYDPKSSESAVPYFSAGGRDDEIQRQYIRAMTEYWDEVNASPFYSGNPIVSKMLYWSFDARPWPTFPNDGDTWADQANWFYGHWISGRIETVYVPDLLEKLAEDFGITASYDFGAAYGSCDGFVVQSKASFRSMTESLASLFHFDIIESGDTLKAVSRLEVLSRATVDLDDLAETGGEAVTLTRAQSTDLPVGMEIKFIEPFNDYEISSVSQRREVVSAESLPSSETPIVMDSTRAQQLVDRLLYSAWARKTTGEFGLLPEFIYLEPGDVVTINAEQLSSSDLRIETISEGNFRAITAKSFDGSIFTPVGSGTRTRGALSTSIISTPVTVFMDLPMLTSIAIPWRPYVASYVTPWAGVNIFKSITNSNYQLDTTVAGPTVIGETTALFSSGETGSWDEENTLSVLIYSGQLSTLDELNVLNGQNSIAIENSSGGWEIVQFVTATPTGTRTYDLTQLLRGQLGTEDNMEDNLLIGARIVLLQSTVQQLAMELGDIGREYYFKYGPSNRDIGHSTYSTTQETFTGRGLKPFSPVHLSSSSAPGLTLLSWVRRDRVGGDNWDYTDDIPLSEAYERYEVDILDGSDMVVRTIEVENTTVATYSDADRTSDGIPITFDFVVYQMSDLVGRGTGRRGTANG